MKKMKAIFLVGIMCLALTACVEKGSSTTDAKNSTEKAKEGKKKENLTLEDFDELLSSLPIAVVSTEYVVQDENYKSLYPDMLQAILKNNTELDIKDAVVAFVGWDENNLPVKISGNIDFSGGDYIKKVNFSDMNLVPGGQTGEDKGFSVNEKCGISSFKAIVVSYEAFDGSTWKNPYYDEFVSLYEGKKFDSALTVEVEIEEVIVENQKKSEDIKEESISNAELDEIIKNQDIAVLSTKYVVQDENYKSLYPDMLQVILKNNTELDIKNAIVAFVGWDKNNLPVKIKGSLDFTGGDYLKKVDYSDINMIPGGEFGEDSGFSVDEKCEISTFKAIVVSYEAYDGTTWKNPYYDDFVSLYEGKKAK